MKLKLSNIVWGGAIIAGIVMFVPPVRDVVYDFVFPDEVAEIKLSTNKTGLIISGRIDDHITERVKDMVAANKDVDTITLTSGGGLLHSGLSLGKFIQEKGFNTIAIDRCFSACGLIFMAGKIKFVSPSTDVGFHRPYIDNSDDSYVRNNEYFLLKGESQRQLVEYWNNLGLDHTLYYRMIGADADEMYIPTKEDGRTFGMVYMEDYGT